MKKIAQLVKKHLKGKQTQSSKKVISHISKKLIEAGFKPPFKYKLASDGPDIVFDSELPDEMDTPVTVTAFVYPEEPRTMYDPGIPEQIEIFLYYEDTGKEVPEEVLHSLPGFENYMSNLEMEVSEKLRSRTDFDADRRLDEMKDRKLEQEYGIM